MTGNACVRPTAAAAAVDRDFVAASAQLGLPAAAEAAAETLPEALAVAAFVRGRRRGPCTPGEPWLAAELTQ